MQKGKLHFEGMFCDVCYMVFAEEWAFVLERGSQRLIDRNVTERGSPGSARQDGKRLAWRTVTDTKDQDFLGENDAGKNCSGDMAREWVAGVGNEASLYEARAFVGLRSQVSANLRNKFLTIIGIKTASDSGWAKHNGSRVSDSFGRFAFNLEGFLGSGIVEYGDFVSVLIPTFVDDLLHFGASGI